MLALAFINSQVRDGYTLYIYGIVLQFNRYFAVPGVLAIFCIGNNTRIRSKPNAPAQLIYCFKHNDKGLLIGKVVGWQVLYKFSHVDLDLVNKLITIKNHFVLLVVLNQSKL